MYVEYLRITMAYEVLEILAGKSTSNGGCSATISKVRCSQDGKEYVKKAFPYRHLESGELQEKDVFREITLLQMLSDTPHINKLVEVVNDDSDVSLILEWCKLGNLQNLEVITECQMRSICEKMTIVLLRLRYLGIVHMDMNPENIFISAVNEDFVDAELGDFGFSLYCEEGQYLQFEQPRCSYNIYSAPEILKGERFDHKVDIFSLGISLAVSLGLHAKSEVDSSDNEVFFMEDAISEAMVECVISANAGDLLLKMVNRDANNRISLEAILEHP